MEKSFFPSVFRPVSPYILSLFFYIFFTPFFSCFFSCFLYHFPGTFFALFFFPALAALQSATAPPDTILPVSPDIIFLFVIARFFAQEFEKKFFVFFIAPHIVFYVVFTTIRAHSGKNILYFIYNRLPQLKIPCKNHFLLCFFKA